MYSNVLLGQDDKLQTRILELELQMKHASDAAAQREKELQASVVAMSKKVQRNKDDSAGATAAVQVSAFRKRCRLSITFSVHSTHIDTWCCLQDAQRKVEEELQKVQDELKRTIMELQERVADLEGKLKSSRDKNSDLLDKVKQYETFMLTKK